jgi:reverse gyrase
MYLLIPDAPTYLQASGRTSRLYLGGISRGISIVLVDDPRLLKGLERRISWMVEDFSFSELERGKLSGMIEEVDRDRELVRLVRAGLLSKEELERQRGLEFKTSLLVVESPNKARTIANFFGTPSVKEYGRLRVYEVSLGNQTILITATGGHVYELVTGPPLKLGDWRDLFGVAARDGRYVPLYTSIRRCPRCLQQFTGVGEEKACPYCGSSFLTDSLEVVEAIREVAREVDEILVGTDPDTEGEKIAYDLLNALKPLNPNVRRVEFHEVTKRALLGALAGPRGVNVDLVKAQLVRRVEDRWIGFSLSKLLQEGFGNKNLSAGRVQTPVLGWVIEAAWKWRRTKKRYLSATVGDLEFVFELPRELAGIGFGAVERMEVEIYGKEREEIKLGPHPPFTTDAALSELSSSLRIPVSRIMEILQDLFEAGFITYHRTDSTRISEAGMRVAEEYLRQMGWEELLVRRSWGEGGAHEAIRPYQTARLPDPAKAHRGGDSGAGGQARKGALPRLRCYLPQVHGLADGAGRGLNGKDKVQRNPVLEKREGF